MPKIELINVDCMDYMATLPDKAFHLAIIDPPYGIERFKKGGSNLARHCKYFDNGKNWNNNKPDKTYFDELFRVSKNQIIWGGNYFCLPESKHFIFWHKIDAAPSFAAGELAWVSIDKPAAYYSSVTEKYKNHPAQKPVKLYNWLLHNYAKPGQRILDTHLGSASSAIAAHYFGVDFVGCEIDEDYYNAAVKRFEHETAQTTLFD